MARFCWLLIAVIALVLFIFYNKSRTQAGLVQKSTSSGKLKAINLTVTSESFAHKSSLPIAYTCDGENVSPPLAWSGAPANTKSYTLICDDPDAPMGTWVHWVLFNISPEINNISENIDENRLGPSVKKGENSWGKTGFGGACPPSGTHRYFFRIYALNTILTIDGNPTKTELLDAMKGHVLAEGELIGTYARTKKVE